MGLIPEASYSFMELKMIAKIFHLTEAFLDKHKQDPNSNQKPPRRQLLLKTEYDFGSCDEKFWRTQHV